MKRLLRNNLVACVLVCVLISLGMVNESSADLFTDPNLVGFWQFSGDANDSSYFGNDGTLYGDAVANSDILELDGTDDYVDCGNGSSLKTEGDLTISAWIKAITNRACIYSHTWNNFRLGFGIGNNNYDGRLGFYTSTHGQWIEAGNSLADDTWHHVTVTLKGNMVRLYTDGFEIGNDTGAPATNLTGNADIGIYSYAWNFNGKIDDVMIYNVALEAWEIRQLYDEGNKAHVYSNEIVGDVFRGSNCTASGTKAVALGDGTTASGEYSTALGKDTVASGVNSIALGRNTEANYYDTIAMGFGTTSSGGLSTAMGNQTTASGATSTAMGGLTTASGFCSTTMGYGSEAAGELSIAAGLAIQTTEDVSMAFGKYSINDVADSFTVGYGSGEGNEQVDFRVRSGLVNVYGDLDVTDKVTMGTLVLPVKTSTGDPASPVEGQIYVNTYDNKVRVYADGAWRDLATW